MKRFILPGIVLFLSSCAVHKTDSVVSQKDVERIVKTLSSDEMEGRAVFTPGIEKAAKFIESEFKDIGLKPLPGQSTFRQDLSKTSIEPSAIDVKVNGNSLDNDNVLVITDKPALKWNNQGAEIQYIKSGESFMSRYYSIVKLDKPVIVLVDEQFFDAFNKVRKLYSSERVIENPNPTRAAVFLLGVESAASYQVNFSNTINKVPLFNIAGIIPGRSKAQEYVIFSGHYDHLGIIDAVNEDSIANGADDDASGVTAVISLARYYKKLNYNERTLIFVAFTDEESGGTGSKYFASKINPGSVVAMFNIEMIGKESKFGKNSAFITGFDKSDFGQILQKNLEATAFKFYPDPYPEQQLFYRSDNASLAAVGVPAHTISTDQIDIDKLYHTVDDEFESLDVQNILATIKAIALSSRSIVAGKDTPKRIVPLK